MDTKEQIELKFKLIAEALDIIKEQLIDNEKRIITLEKKMEEL